MEGDGCLVRGAWWLVFGDWCVVLGVLLLAASCWLRLLYVQGGLPHIQGLGFEY